MKAKRPSRVTRTPTGWIVSLGIPGILKPMRAKMLRVAVSITLTVPPMTRPAAPTLMGRASDRYTETRPKGPRP